MINILIQVSFIHFQLYIQVLSFSFVVNLGVSGLQTGYKLHLQFLFLHINKLEAF